MKSIETLEQRVGKIEARNARVETDKAWEGSLTRRGLLMLFTYLAIGIYMWAIGVMQPWLNAVIPTAGFMLSTFTMPFFKKMWLKNRSRKQG